MSDRVLRLVALVAVVAVLVLPGTALAAPGGQGDTWHVVAAGEALSVIALRYGVTVSAIVSVNQLANPNAIYAGQRLLIPVPGSVVAWPNEHVVVAGESLTSIASLYRISVADLAAANGLRVTDYVFVDQVLVIPAGPQPALDTTFGCASYHRVQPGDTLSSIASRYQVTVGALMQANKLQSEMIYAGRSLCVPGGAAESAPGVSAPGPAMPPGYDVPPAYGPPAESLQPYAPPAFQVPAPPPTGAPFTPPYPEGNPNLPGGIYPLPPATGQPLTYQPPNYPPYPIPPSTVPAEFGLVAPVPQFAPASTTGVTVVRTVDTWLGNQTADPEDPDHATTLMVMVWEGKGAKVAVGGANGFVARGTADVNFEFSWVPTFIVRGIPEGNYIVFIEGEPSRVAWAEVHGGHRPLVEFRKKSLTAEGGALAAQAIGLPWVAEVVQNTNGTKPIGSFSILVVRTGTAGQTIRVSAPGGFETTCMTGTKPEHGTGACDIGGLSAGTYQVVLDGTGVGVEIYLDGQGIAKIEFHPV